MALPQNIKVVKSFNQKRKSKTQDDNNFHVIIAPVLALAQFFGFFPFVGVFAKTIKSVRFKWISFRAVHSLLWLASALVFSACELLNLSKSGTLNAKNINGVIFFFTGFLSCVFFFRLAKQWPDVLDAFDKVEAIFEGESYAQSSGWTLKKRIRLASAVLLLLALSEHSMSWTSTIHDRLLQIELCNWEIGSMFYYIATTHLPIYAEVPVNFFVVVWAEYMNISFTFAWSFVDLFIIIISIGVAAKFNRINARLEYFRGRIVTDDFWEQIRCDYNQVCELQELIDEKIGNIVCLACLNDLYYVCLQLINVATKLPFLINAVYYWYSLLFLIARTSAMFFISSSIHDESKKALKVLRTIPTDGKKFFVITRGIIISIAGTIVTYELVLLQFDTDKIETGMTNPCPDP